MQLGLDSSMTEKQSSSGSKRSRGASSTLSKSSRRIRSYEGGMVKEWMGSLQCLVEGLVYPKLYIALQNERADVDTADFCWRQQVMWAQLLSPKAMRVKKEF